MRRLAVAAVLAAVVAAVWLFMRPEAGSDGAADQAPTRRFLIVGIDGLDWERTQRLVGEGRMPNLARLIDQGAWGALRSIDPYRSPSIWTSIATGKLESKHGITGYMADRGAESAASPLATSNLRRAKAIWQIFSSADRTVEVVGWLVTFPAEPVAGVMVSSHTVQEMPAEEFPARSAEDFEGMRTGVYPPELWEEVAVLRIGEDALPGDAVDSLLGAPVPDEREAALRIAALRRFVAGDLTGVNIATRFMVTRPADLTAVYIQGVDLVCHFFWRYMDPDSWGPGRLSQAAVLAFAPIVDRYYERADAMLGELLSLRGEDTVAIVCSDHGFVGHRGRPDFQGDVAMATQMHGENGIIVIAGPGVAGGRRIEGASVLDVTPTVLVLSGLPVGRDMDGRPLTGAIAQEFLDAHPVSFIDTYETDGPGGGGGPVASPVDEEMKERLRSLGYIK